MNKKSQTCKLNVVMYNRIWLSMWIWLIGGFLLPAGCKPTEKAVSADIKGRSANYLIRQLSKTQLKFEWLSAKLTTTTVIGNTKHSTTAQLRIKKDSVIWISVSPALGIEALRIFITTDSLKYINRINNTYFCENISYLNKIMLSDIDYNILQSLLTDNIVLPEIEGTEKDEHMKSSVDEGYYMLSSLGRRKLKKTIQGRKEINFPVERIWLDPKTFKITKLLINDFSAKRVFELRYSEFSSVDEQLLPNKISLNIIGEKLINAEVEFSKIILNKPQNFPFTIPDKYERVY